MTFIDFNARAELYLGSDWQVAAEQGPKSFRTAAQAIRFAFEEAAPVSLHGARLQIGDRIYSNDELPWLYRSLDYPFPRKRQRKTMTHRAPGHTIEERT
jgi:hypothetical protein